MFMQTVLGGLKCSLVLRDKMSFRESFVFYGYHIPKRMAENKVGKKQKVPK